MWTQWLGLSRGRPPSCSWTARLLLRRSSRQTAGRCLRQPPLAGAAPSGSTTSTVSVRGPRRLSGLSRHAPRQSASRSPPPPSPAPSPATPLAATPAPNQPQAVAFELTAAEARRALLRFLPRLAPHSVRLQVRVLQPTPTLLPFWAWDCTVYSRFQGTVCTARSPYANGPLSGLICRLEQQREQLMDFDRGWTHTGWHALSDHSYRLDEPAMQTYAGFRHRRATAQHMRLLPGFGPSLRPLDPALHLRQPPDHPRGSSPDTEPPPVTIPGPGLETAPEPPFLAGLYTPPYSATGGSSSSSGGSGASRGRQQRRGYADPPPPPSSPFPQSAAEFLPPKPPNMDPFEVALPLSWSIVEHRIRLAEIARACKHLVQVYQATDVKNVKMQMQVLHKAPTPIYIPVYVFETDYLGAPYAFLVSALTGQVAGQRLYSPLAVSAIVGSLFLPAMALTGTLLSVWAWATSLFATAVAALAAKYIPQIRHGHLDLDRLRIMSRNETYTSMLEKDVEGELDRREAAVEAQMEQEKEAAGAVVGDAAPGRVGDGALRDPSGLYALLGLGHRCQQATLTEIKDAFRTQALLTNPNLVGKMVPPSQRAAVDRRWEALLHAYRVLRNPERRAAYDEGTASNTKAGAHLTTGLTTGQRRGLHTGVRARAGAAHAELRGAEGVCYACGEPGHVAAECAAPLVDDLDLERAQRNQPHRLPHQPVMLQEVLHYLQPTSGGLFLDATFGAGGYTRGLLESVQQGGQRLRVVAADCDPAAVACAQRFARSAPGSILPLRARFSELGNRLKAAGLPLACLDGAVFDVGVSSMQLDEGERGFSFLRDGPLDMRMDHGEALGQESQLMTAADAVRWLSVSELARIFSLYGDERYAMRVAESIVRERSAVPITTTAQLADLVASVIPSTAPAGMGKHPATKTFQALRIFVNNELGELEAGLEQVTPFIKPGGRLVVVSFHALEDRVVKAHFRSGGWAMQHRKLVRPQEDEVERNQRSRSARLRAAVKSG